MDKKIDIFITAFKNFKRVVSNNIYKVITVKDYEYKGCLDTYKDNIGDNISNMNGFFNELTVFYWVWKNYPLKDYVGMCSYRRYFDFLDDIDYISQYLNDYDIIVPIETQLFGLNNIEQYDKCHNLNDLFLILKIIKELYPEYIDDINYFSLRGELYANNMFIMKTNDFIKYCEFLFSILNEFLIRKNFKNYSDITNYINENQSLYLNKVHEHINNVEYQSRLGGFLAERIFTIYVSHNFTKVLELPIFFSETKKIKKIHRKFVKNK